jgi:hypothetical protein
MRRRLVALTAVLAAVGVAAFFGTAARSSGPPPSGGWAPGKAAPLTAAMELPVVAAPPAQLAADIGASASIVGGSSDQALSTLRLVRSDLGATHSDLYIYSAGDNGWCIFLWERQSQCPSAPSSPTPGALYYLSPGGPGYVGQGDDVPAAVAGIVGDNIKAVTLKDEGSTVNLPIVNNAFYSDVADDPNSAFSISLEFTYVDGSTKAVTLDNGGTFTVSPAK